MTRPWRTTPRITAPARAAASPADGRSRGSSSVSRSPPATRTSTTARTVHASIAIPARLMLIRRTLVAANPIAGAAASAARGWRRTRAGSSGISARPGARTSVASARPTGASATSSATTSIASSARPSSARGSGRRPASRGRAIRSLLVDVAAIRGHPARLLRACGLRSPGDGATRGRTVRAVPRAERAGQRAGLRRAAGARRQPRAARSRAGPARGAHRVRRRLAPGGGREHLVGAAARTAAGRAARRGPARPQAPVGAMRRRIAVLAALGATVAAGCGPTAKAPAPSGGAGDRATFVGLVSDDAFTAQGLERGRILHRQALAGVRLLRQTFDWALIERRPGRYRLGYFDDYVLDAAGAGITVMPVLFGPPAFRTAAGRRRVGDATPPPSDPAVMARFAQALVRRYGPDGTVWRDRNVSDQARHPIRAWQIWNEPNLPAYWGGKPSAAGYARMLKVVGGAIKRVDPGAKVLTGGIPNSKLGIPFSRYVRQLVRAGAGHAFDVLAIHPYARDPGGVVAAVAGAHALLSRLGAGKKKLWVTEFGWASGGPGSPFTVPPQVQAANTGAVISQLGRNARRLGLEGIVYYNWRDAQPYPGGKDFWGLHTGLLRENGAPKPALRAFSAAAVSLPAGE